MESKKGRIAALQRLIQGYQDSYYNGEAEISDGEFDLLWDELKSLAPDSEVLQKVGAGHDVDGFPKARHLIPMGSQDKASNPQEFLDWAEKRAAPFIVQYKLDGASLELQYEKGKLVKAVTRGDGVIGDNITANARLMSGTIPALDIPFTGGVRGEVVMARDVWKRAYSSRANCRNAANGIMRRKDGQGCQDLNLIVYDAAVPGDDRYFQGEDTKIQWLKERGFQTAVSQAFTEPQEIIAYRGEVAAGRENLPFDIDGLVVKDIEIDMADLRKARPEKQIAFKFELETAFSVLRQVLWSESGATYTPIGVIDPVRLAGTTVKRANLNNPDMIRAMGLSIGAVVSVVKRGEIIPKIEGLAPVQPAAETQDIQFPVTCASCDTALVDGGTRLYCPNPLCPKRLLHRLEKWVSALDIRDLGEKLILQLFEKQRVRNVSDLYTLEAGELAAYERMGDLSAAKVVRYIQTKQELPLAVFTAGFDFEGIAETTMEKLVSAGFDTLEKLRAAMAADFASVRGLGEITASVIVQGLKECAPDMDAVLQAGVITIAPPPAAESLPLSGLSFCFTGELKSMKRGQAEEKIKALGAQAKDTVVKNLSYLVTNDPASGSSKNQKARTLGVPIIDEEQFLALLSGAARPVTPNPVQTGPPAPMQGELF